MTGFEPATLCSQSRCATKLRYIPVVPPAGFEPATLGLEGRCSIQLSYGGTQPRYSYWRQSSTVCVWLAAPCP